MFDRSLGPAITEGAQSNNNNVSLCLKCISQFNLFAALSSWPGLSTLGFISTYLRIIYTYLYRCIYWPGPRTPGTRATQSWRRRTRSSSPPPPPGSARRRGWGSGGTGMEDVRIKWIIRRLWLLLESRIRRVDTAWRPAAPRPGWCPDIWSRSTSNYGTLALLLVSIIIKHLGTIIIDDWWLVMVSVMMSIQICYIIFMPKSTCTGCPTALGPLCFLLFCRFLLHQNTKIW